MPKASKDTPIRPKVTGKLIRPQIGISNVNVKDNQIIKKVVLTLTKHQEMKNAIKDCIMHKADLPSSISDPDLGCQNMTAENYTRRSKTFRITSNNRLPNTPAIDIIELEKCMNVMLKCGRREKSKPAHITEFLESPDIHEKL